MSSALADAVLAEEGGGEHGGGIDGYIASLQLERSNTRASTLSALQRRRTLMKHASDPEADQQALELEIRQVERLASLLGRRQTKFDRKRERPTVNHDLDSTLEGFFDVQDENDRVAEVLLSGEHRAGLGREEGDADTHDGRIENPVLSQQNIHSAPSALIATQLECEYEHIADPFDKIDEMHLAKSPSGSAEYLPLDSYHNENSAADSSDPSEGLPVPSVDLPSAMSKRLSRGKANVVSVLAVEDDSAIPDDSLLLGINRSNTWKRQSTMLIQERSMLGPALPQIPDDPDEDEEMNEEMDTERNVGGSLAPALFAFDGPPEAATPAPAPSTLESPLANQDDLAAHGVYANDSPNTAVVSEYLDILDFIDAKDLSTVEVRAGDADDDGHISSDLLANSDSSDIDLSDDGCGGGSESSDSDNQYLAKIAPHRRFTIVNVVDPPEPANEPATSQPLAAVGSGLGSHSTLRRNRRLLTKRRPTRSDSVNQQNELTAAPTSEPIQSTESAVEASSSALAAHRFSLPTGNYSVPATEYTGALATANPSVPATVGFRGRDATPSTRPDSLFAAGRGIPAAGLATPATSAGLAEMAQAAAAAATQMSTVRATRGLSVSATGSAWHKPLPPVPDRLLRTLQVARSDGGKAPPPPLPAKARPKVPRALSGDRLCSDAAIAAALERPSSKTLFTMHRAATLQPAQPAGSEPAGAESPLGLRAWLQRTDVLTPASADNAVAAKQPPSLPLAPRPMTGHGKSVRARGRVVRKVPVPPPSAQTPTRRPASSNSSIHSSASHPGTSPQPSPPPLPAPARNSHLKPDSPMTGTTATTSTAALSEPLNHAQPLSPAYPFPQPYPHQYPCQYPYQHEAMPNMAVPTVLSAPPGCSLDFSPDTAGELVEPSAPMLVEPSAPELPEQWSVASPHSYAFPQPAHYEVPGLQHAYGVEPGMAPAHAAMGFAVPMVVLPQPHTMPAATSSPVASLHHNVPPRIPDKPRPRPLSVPESALSKPLPLPPTHAAHQPHPPTAYAPDRTSAPAGSNSSSALPASPAHEYVMVEEEEEKARLNAICVEYQGRAGADSATTHLREDSVRPSRTSSLIAKQLPPSPSLPPPLLGSVAPSSLSIDTQTLAPNSAALTAVADSSLPADLYASNDESSIAEDPALQARNMERQREIKRKAALFELVDTERSYTNDLRMVVELFLLPIQLLGNRKIVDVIFGDMVKITEMNGKMYIDMITRLGPLACMVDPERASRNRRKKKNVSAAARPSGTPMHLSGPSRSVLQGSSLRSPASPSVSASASTTMSRRLSSHGDQQQQRSARRASVHSCSDITTSLESMSLSQAALYSNEDGISMVSNGDDLSIATSNSGGSGPEPGELRYLATVAGAGSAAAAAAVASFSERHGSVRSIESVTEEDESDASRWTEDQVMDYFKNVCIGDVMSNYLKDFSEHYAQYSANHDKALEYLKLVRESSSRLNLRSDATRDAHQKLLQTLERAEKDSRVRRLRLESFLLSPVQRVMRYPLLLEALLKYTPEDHPDHEDVALALSIAGSVATEVDRKSEELVNRQRLAELQSTFDWAHLLGGVQLKLDTFTKLVGQRKFVRKGPLRKASSGKHLYAILFNDFMMITMSDRRGGVWCYEPYRLPIQTYDMLARDPVKDQFELVNLKNGEVLQLRADTPAEASDWVKDIMRTANYCYDVMCEALTSGIQVSKVKSVISQEAREKILQGGKPSVLGRRF